MTIQKVKSQLKKKQLKSLLFKKEDPILMNSKFHSLRSILAEETLSAEVNLSLLISTLMLKAPSFTNHN